MASFTCQLPQTRSLHNVLCSLIVHKPQWVTLTFESGKPLLVRAESDDMSVQGTLTVPLDWFGTCTVGSNTSPTTIDVCLELHGFLQCLQMGGVSGGPVLLSYPNESNGGVTMRWKSPTAPQNLLECAVLPRQMYARPLDLHFGHHPVVNRFECDGPLLRECLQTFLDFGATSIVFQFGPDGVTMESCGCPAGGLTTTMGLGGDSHHRLDVQDPSMRVCYLAHHIAAALCNRECQNQQWADRVAVMVNGQRLLRVVQQWRGVECLTNAVVEVIVVPMMLAL